MSVRDGRWMSNVALDRLLAVLVLAMAVTGGLTLRAGDASAAWLFTLHGLIGGSLVAAVVVKLRRSLPRAISARRWPRLAVAGVVTILALGSLAGGFAWVAAGQLVTVGPWTVLTLHAILGLALAPIVVLHLLPHRWRVLRPRPGPAVSGAALVSRRSLLVAGLFGVFSLAAWGGAAVVERVRGGERRFTGSRWLPSGGIPPVTTFFGEATPPIDHDGWSVTVAGRVRRPATYRVDELPRLGETELVAVLDCTGGWAMETSWRGVLVADLLDASGPEADARRVEVRSVTGWAAGFSLEEA
ncbi:MAG: molybdopterin-dependent oxidoreductase, partial [Chloroflexota bacterium]|nr:molybdopterin-dependent oxidoreductase [Chloroflexota bacterium]